MDNGQRLRSKITGKLQRAFLDIPLVLLCFSTKHKGFLSPTVPFFYLVHFISLVAGRVKREQFGPFWVPQTAQRSCGCPLPGSVQGQAGQGFDQPGLVEGVPAHGRGGGTGWSIRSLPAQTIIWFYDLQLAWTLNNDKTEGSLQIIYILYSYVWKQSRREGVFSFDRFFSSQTLTICL